MSARYGPGDQLPIDWTRPRGPPNLPPPSFPLPPPSLQLLRLGQAHMLNTNFEDELPPPPAEPPRRFSPNLLQQPKRKIPPPPGPAPRPPISAFDDIPALQQVQAQPVRVRPLQQQFSPPQPRPASPPRQPRPVSPPQQPRSPPSPQESSVPEDVKYYVVDNLYRTALANKFLQYSKYIPGYAGIHKLTFQKYAFVETIPPMMSPRQAVLQRVFGERATRDDNGAFLFENPTLGELFKVIDTLVSLPEFDLSAVVFEPSSLQPFPQPPPQRPVSPPRQQQQQPLRPASPPRPSPQPPQQQQPRPSSPPKSKNTFTIRDDPNDPIDDNYFAAAQQQQRSGEDRFQAKRFGSFRYYAVFDGHGGTRKMGPKHIADYLTQHLHERLADALYKIDLQDPNLVANTIKQVFIDMDTEMENKNLEFGSTATVVLIDDHEDIIYQINLGDSRSATFDRQGNILSVTKDHEPGNPIEKARIEKAGGSVNMLQGVNRVDHALAVARAFGDFEFKQNNDVPFDPINGKVSAVPDVTILPKPVDPFYIMLTSDAPYGGNGFTGQDLINMFLNDTITYAQYTKDPAYRLKRIADDMVKQIQPRTTDDITVMLVLNGTQT